MSDSKPNRTSSVSQPNIALWVPNLIGYFRLALILLSWKFALTEPKIFLALYGTSYLLDAVDGNVARLLNQCSFYGAQLDILVDRFATSTIIFAVLKLGLLNIPDESDRMIHSFFFGSLFIIDFVSHWFQVYSNYLIGYESHHEASKYESKIVNFYYSSQIVLFVTCVLAELYIVKFYINFFPKEFETIINHQHYTLVT